MRNAPPVVFPVGFFVGVPLSVMALALLSALVLTIWLSQAGADPVVQMFACSVWGLTVMLTLWWRRHEWLDRGQLCWTGQEWLWTDAHGHEQQLSVHVQIDAVRGMLLRLQFKPADQRRFGVTTLARWAWLRKRDMPSHWHGFRCAVYSRPVDAA